MSKGRKCEPGCDCGRHQRPDEGCDDVNTHLHKMRLDRRWTQREMAFRIGSTPAHVSGIENRRYTPSLGTLMRYAEAFDTTVSDLLFEVL